MDSMFDLVDSWVTFNEPHIFTMLTYMCGSWPGNNPEFLEIATSTLPMGVFHRALHWMAVAHSKAYDYIHGKMLVFFPFLKKISYGFLSLAHLNNFQLLFCSSLKKPLVGVAHHVSFMRPYGLFDIGAVTISNSLTMFSYIDSICEKLDFIGINYYGQVRELRVKIAFRSQIWINNIAFSRISMLESDSEKPGSSVWCWTKACRD